MITRTQFYPEFEVFHVAETMWRTYQGVFFRAWDGPGWYWVTRFSGPRPNSRPVGPFDTEDDALDSLADSQTSKRRTS